MRRKFLLSLGALVVAGCAAPQPAKLGTDGKPLPKVYQINDHFASRIQFRFLDGLNSLRQVAGAGPVQFNAALNASAATHSRDMAVQNRPWHFGSDGSSPLDRLARVGYPGQLLGENISETFETELETLAAWMKEPETRNVMLDPRANEIGFAWFQEATGKIWWTLVIGSTTVGL